jgi:hypothetical protein
MQATERANDRTANLDWLTYLFTGDRAPSVELLREAPAVEDRSSGFFSNWMLAWSRKIFISKLLGAVRDDLGASARRTEMRPVGPRVPPRGSRNLLRGTSKIQLERALLAIDLFPRCALVLSVFEKLSRQDTAVLIGGDCELVRKGEAIAFGELTRNLLQMQSGRSGATASTVFESEYQHA